MQVREKVMLVGVFKGQSNREDAEESMDELAALVETAGGEVAARVLQERGSIHPATFTGRGKVEEIGALCEERDIDLVVFDDDLSPAQARNIEELTGRRVIDRSQLILDIFALGAQTSVAKAQVELAQIEYTLPRLRRMWEHLSRTGGGIGTRGPGETQLEVDRRRIRRRMFTLKKQLGKFEQDRAVRTSRRGPFVKASLVGYTNTGKSTLFNGLTKANVTTGDRLFETLDATTRVLMLPLKEVVLLSDTVGFIRKIPHHLVASFHATLECVIDADIVIHVADISHPGYESQIATVRSVLEDIGASGKHEILVFNKVDVVKDEDVLKLALRKHEGAIPLSALCGWGVDAIKERLLKDAMGRKEKITVSLPPKDGKMLSYLHKYGTVLGQELVGGRLSVVVKIERRYMKPLTDYIESPVPEEGRQN
ncbi:MAG: GTPase HflX [Candidatus Eisenbacteria bacterium]